jgi:hypothetical protein
MFQKIVLAIFCLVLLFAFGSVITTGIHGWRTDTISQTAAVTTGGGVTTGTVTLTRDPLNNATTEITSITSSIAETPVVDSYTTATNALLLSNLTAGQSRTLTITYSSERQDTIMQALGPYLMFIVFGIILGCIAWGLFAKGKKGR